MLLYQEYPPHPALQPYVACMWSCSASAAAAPYGYRVLPDNCIDILWQNTGIPGFVTGMMTASKDVMMTAHVSTVAVRFKPGRATQFFRLPLNELTDLHADIGDLWGRERAEKIHDALWTKPLSERERLSVLERHLTAHLAANPAALTPSLVDHAVATIESSGGVLRIDTLARTTGVTRQHLATRFRAEVGIPAKTFARICRFRRAMHAIRDSRTSAKRIDWVELALKYGYFDQAHLIHEFQEFTNSSPDSFAARLTS